MISAELWPVALLEAIWLSNITYFNTDGNSFLSHFTHSDTMFDIKDEHTFGYPIYILNSILQSGLSIPK